MEVDDVRVCNCAGCGRPLVSAATFAEVGAAKDWKDIRERLGQPQRIAGRINDRPYCLACLDTRRVPGGSYGPHDEPGPGWDDAVKASEEDR